LKKDSYLFNHMNTDCFDPHAHMPDSKTLSDLKNCRIRRSVIDWERRLCHSFMHGQVSVPALLHSAPDTCFRQSEKGRITKNDGKKKSIFPVCLSVSQAGRTRSEGSCATEHDT
jgi:hypothetical protein